MVGLDRGRTPSGLLLLGSPIWRRWKIQPPRIETFKFSTDPQLEATLRDVVSLYLSQPRNTVVLSIDEKTQIQALSRTQPVQLLAPEHPVQQAHDYRRNGTTTRFVSLDVLAGKLRANEFYQKPTNVELVDLLQQVAEVNPGIDLHVVCDNYASHKYQNVKDWLSANPRVSLYFTPHSSSWMNIVEIFFGIITRQWLQEFELTCSLPKPARTWTGSRMLGIYARGRASPRGITSLSVG